MPVVVTMIGTDVTIEPTAGPGRCRARARATSPENSWPMKMSWARSGGVPPRSGPALHPRPELEHRRPVDGEVQVGTADAARLDVDEHLAVAGSGSATSSRTCMRPGAQDGGAHHRTVPSVEAGEEVEERGVDLGGPLLLHPVAGAVDEHGAAVIGDERVHRRRRAHHEDRVVGAADEQRRHLDLGAGEGLGEVPVAVEVAVPVEAAGEPGAGELGAVVVQLVLGQPVRQAVGLGDALDEPAAVVRHRRRVDRRRRVAAACAASSRRIVVAGSRPSSSSATPGSWKYSM